VRTKTFFFTTPSGNTAWTDFAPASSSKFMIEPRLTLADDVGVAAISNPVGALSIDNCGIVPQATVSNFGSNDQLTPFDVSFSIKQNGAVVYTNTKQVAVSSGESKAVYFDAFSGSVSGIDSSFVITSLSGDAATNNDTVVNRFTTANFSYSDSTAGSDGYSYSNSTSCASAAPLQPTYNWITQTDNQVDWGDNGDDSIYSTPIALPFPFKFFGNTYNQFWICSNGWISFTNPANIPVAGGIENYIAGILTDLDNTATTFGDAQTFYGADGSSFVITFNHAHLFGSADDFISFQIILKVNGDIVIQYNDAESTAPAVTSITNFCSVGIENANGTKGIRYRLNGSGGSVFGSPLALQFYTRPLSPVPVSLLRFAAEKGKYANTLKWSTAQETNSREFIIERSNDGTEFTERGRVAASGNSSGTVPYSFMDEAPLKGINYYRLKMVNRDNTAKYSTVISVRNDMDGGFAVYPNPVSNKMTVGFDAGKASAALLQVFDLNGKLMQTKNVQANEGSNMVQVNTEGLAAGSYILKLQLEGDVVIGKFSKL
jgi:Secretion system C-terminal sorting domain